MADDEDFYSGLARLFTPGAEATDKSSNLFSPEDVLSWIHAVEVYLKKTEASCLELTAIKFEFHVLESIMVSLLDSQVTELVLEQFDVLGENMKRFCQLLKQTKIKSLNINQCKLFYDDLIVLVEILNDTEVVDFNAAVYYVSSDENQRQLDLKKGKKLVSALLRSHLTRLDLNLSELLDDSGMLLLAEGLRNTSLAHLDVRWGCVKNSTVFASTISKLLHCSVIDLNLSGNEVGRHSIEELRQNLVGSKLQKLDLSFSEIDDMALDVLAQGLVLSNIIELNLESNKISGLNSFGHCLKNTKIKVLNLGSNFIRHREIFALPDFLKGSLVESLNLCVMNLSDELGAELLKSFKFTKVSKLNLRGNHLKLQSISAFAEVLEDTSLEDVNFLGINLPIGAFDILSESGCVNGSKLKYIRFQAPDKPEKTISFLRFLERTNNPSSFLVDIEGGTTCDLSASHAKLLAQSIGTNITHLRIICCQLDGAFVANLAPHLRHTSILYLDFTSNDINDKGVLTLAKHLKGTKVFSLNLSFNPITNEGAQSISTFCPQTSLIHLNLDNTDIENDGLEILAKHFSGSLVTKLSVCRTLGKNILPIHKILWENLVLSHNLTAFFKRLVTDNSNKYFCFHQYIHNRDISDFLEECLQFHKKVIEQPAVVSLLLREESLSFSRMELVDLLLNKFPLQFVEFISKWIVADISQQVKFLERAQELGLVKIVENLLLLRPLYTIDEAEGILHPYVYKLLLKYKQPICNVAIEPSGVVKIIDYFTQHTNIEGAADVINLLRVTKAI